MEYDIGVAGLAVMGENLVLNMESRGFHVAVFNRTYEKTKRFLDGRAKSKNIAGYQEVANFVGAIKRPRKIMMMVKSGKPVDMFIEQLLPHLEEGDIIIDGGNSDYRDSIRRSAFLEEQNLRFIGSGVSGGEEGALNGPSIMPGGSASAWPEIQPIFEAIAAEVGDGSKCCAWIGPDGAGHFVKMVHNGIEYGDMQLICETYHFMKDVLQMGPEEIHTVFSKWNEGELESYLIEITAEITNYYENDELLLDKIVDAAGQKGTGKWTVINALEAGSPLSLISESVFARCLSSFKELRQSASFLLEGTVSHFTGDRSIMLGDLGKALYGAKIISYTQGFALMDLMAKENNWRLNLAEIASIWRGGCIIRSAFLDKITQGYRNNPDLENLLFDPYFRSEINEAQASMRKVVTAGIQSGIPLPSLTAALSYFDGLRSARLPANLLQAQRDYFGAHMYERTDRPRGEFFHTNWTGTGGDTTSTSYKK